MKPTDIWTLGTPPDGSIMAVKAGTTNEDTDWRWKSGKWYTGFSRGTPFVAKQDQRDAAFGGINSEHKVYLDVMGRPGGPFTGWYFDLEQNTWLRPETAAELAAMNPAITGTTGVPGSAGANPYLLTGTAQSGAGTKKARPAMELTQLRDGRFFYATSKHESGGSDSPHSGVVAAGPGIWHPSFGRPEDSGLPDGVYLVSVSPYDASPEDASVDSDGDGVPDVIVPATRAYKSLLMALQAGDAGAIEAANALGIQHPNTGGGGWLKELFG